jgi:hypothetical protein
MTDERKRRCECPLLRSTAETERMAGCGIIPADGESLVQARIAALTVARMRERYGCNGPNQFGSCMYYQYTRVDLTTDPNVPLLHRKVDDKQGHRYL